MDATTWAILLLLVGLVLLVLEFFVPSGGALAVMCALALVAAIVVGFMAGPRTGLSILLTICLLVPTVLAAAVRWWPETPFGKLMLVARPQSPDDVLPQTIAYRGLKSLIGQRGQSKGLMLPSGLVVIDGQTYDAVSEGVAIEAGQPILVVGVSTQRLIVRPDTTILAEFAQQFSPEPAKRASEPLVTDIADPFAE